MFQALRIPCRQANEGAYIIVDSLKGYSNHAGGQYIPPRKPIEDKMPQGMHEQGDAYWDQRNHDDYWDGLTFDDYDPRD